MIEFATMTAKTKALIAVFALLLLGGGLYVLADPGEHSSITTKDPYTIDIQNRAITVNNVVLGVIDAQGKEPSYKFQTTCEDAMTIIRTENMNAQQEALKLSPDQRTLNEKYRAYVHEAAIVVTDCYDGKQANLTAMNAAKAELL